MLEFANYTGDSVNNKNFHRRRVRLNMNTTLFCFLIFALLSLFFLGNVQITYV